jgi:hypothetical protein
MRRSSYQDRGEKGHYVKLGSRSQVEDLNINSFKLHAGRMPENNFVAARHPLPFYHHKASRSMVHRPFTTQKVQSFLEHRSSHCPIKNKAMARTRITKTLQGSYPSAASRILFTTPGKMPTVSATITSTSTQRAGFTVAVHGNTIKKHSKTSIPFLQGTTPTGETFRLTSTQKHPKKAENLEGCLTFWVKM